MTDEELAPLVRQFMDGPVYPRLIEMHREYLEDDLANLNAGQTEEFVKNRLKKEMMDEFLGCFMALSNADALDQMQQREAQLEEEYNG